MLQFEYYYKKPYFYKKAKRAKRQNEIIISQSDIEKMIVTIRGEQVLIDRDFDEFLSFCTFCNFGLYEYSRNE